MYLIITEWQQTVRMVVFVICQQGKYLVIKGGGGQSYIPMKNAKH